MVAQTGLQGIQTGLQGAGGTVGWAVGCGLGLLALSHFFKK
jgi:hypothetical protein